MEWTHEFIRRKQKELLFPNVGTYYEQALPLESGKGVFVKDVEGREYLDFFGGILTVSVGHCHPAVTEAAVAQQRKLVHVSTLYPTLPQLELAEKVVELRPMKERAKVFFTNSGTEANGRHACASLFERIRTFWWPQVRRECTTEPRDRRRPNLGRG